MNTAKAIPNYDEIQNGVTWMGGTTHELQQQHIPGYQGHVHGLFSENVFGRSFARVTAECVNQRHQKGIDHSLEDRYATSYKNDFNEPDNRKRKFIDTAQNLLQKAEEKQKQINQQVQKEFSKVPKSIDQVAPIDRIPVVGYKGFRPVFRPPKKEVHAPVEPNKIKLKEKQVLQEMITRGVGDEKLYEKERRQEPIVGYTGFMKGIKAENEYAQSYRDLAINSIRR